MNRTERKDNKFTITVENFNTLLSLISTKIKKKVRNDTEETRICLKKDLYPEKKNT